MIYSIRGGTPNTEGRHTESSEALERSWHCGVGKAITRLTRCMWNGSMTNGFLTRLMEIAILVISERSCAKERKPLFSRAE